MLGDIYESKGNYARAVGAYKRALQIDSNNVQIMNSLAVCYLKNNDTQLARELLTSVIQNQPGNSAAHQYLGYCLLRLGEVDKAIESYGRAIAIDDRDWEAHRGMGVAYMMRAIDENNKDEVLKARLAVKAVEHWRKSLSIKPDQPNREKLLRYIANYSGQSP